MKKNFSRRLIVLICLLICSCLFAQEKSVREHLKMDAGWRFAFGHAYDVTKDFNHATSYFSYFAKAAYGADGPAAANFNDKAWRMVDLPHDWAVELPFSQQGGHSHGYKTIGRNFPETSVGWYRKTFTIPESDLGKRITIQFDGIHRNPVVWINGFYLGQQHSGYYSFQYDLTDYINYGGENIIAVRVDATVEEGWYYEGAGIYRHVWLNKTAPLHVAYCGTFVSTDVKDKLADVTARATIVNQTNSEAAFNIIQKIVDAEGKTIASGENKNLSLKPGESNEYVCSINVNNPNLWSIENPYLYKLITTVSANNSPADEYETTFGIRTLRFDAKDGFFLNEKHVLLKGTNFHQDHAGVGTAMPDALQEFRIKRMKEMGSNAIRCSHNPATPEFLDACDRLGMLVIDENRLMGTSEEHLSLLKNMIERDRNHPSVLIWSIGNEEWNMEGNVTGERIASTMQAYVQRLDPTRRVTYAHSGWGDHGIGLVQDMMGFNYIHNGDIDKQHERRPDQPRMGTEETTSSTTRGVYVDDIPNAHVMASDRKVNGHGLEDGFKFYAARPWLAGIFYWTGFDYRGEPNPFGWPQVTSQCGIVDMCGFSKDMFYYLKSWWKDEPTLHILPHWNWPNDKGKLINVWAYSNCDEVELLLNGNSLGKKQTPVNSHLEWNVNYEPGTLSAKGYRNGNEIIAEKIETTGEPAKIVLTPNKTNIKADGEDISIITIETQDKQGRTVPTADNEITFSLKGPGKIIGVGNGDPSSHENDRFVESVSQAAITNVKVKVLKAKESYPEVETGFDDSAWPLAFDDKHEYKYTVKPQGDLTNMVMRGTFDIPGLTSNTEVTLWLKPLGEEEAVYINGHLVAQGVKRFDPIKGYKLDNSFLRNGKNIYAVVGTPLIERYKYDNLNNDPGIVQITKPAETWKRKLFNGYAQVIVQSSKEPGELILEASSNGLKKGEIKIRIEKTNLLPFAE